MGYQHRERKRRARLAQSGSRRQQRSKYADRHYLTIVSRPACCNRCGGSLREGAECVYRYTPREIVCVTCADLERISYRPSLRWERAQPKKGGRRSSAGKPARKRGRSRSRVLVIGKPHPEWPEWTWDGSGFVPTEATAK
jgi:hypothetical protein